MAAEAAGMPAQRTTRRGLRHQPQAADAAARLATIARASGSPGASGSCGWVPAEPARPDRDSGDADHAQDLLLDLRDNAVQNGDRDDDTQQRRRLRHGAPPGRDDLDGWRQRVLDRLPVTIRESRWAVPLTAVAALLAVVGLVGTVVAVRTAAATPGIPVPARALVSAGPSAPSTTSPAGAAGAAPSPTPSSAPSLRAGVDQAGAGVAGDGQARGELVVHVVGQVRKPGVVRLPAGSRVNDAVAAAGGALDAADLTRVNLARVLVDGEQLFVPRPGEELPAEVAAAPAGGGRAGQAGEGADVTGAGAAAGQGAPLNLNTATSAQLQELPGVGPVLAGRILQWREENGRFSSVDELGEVSGIGPKVLERLRPLVTL